MIKQMSNFSANCDKILETIKQIESKINYLSQIRKQNYPIWS
jgi:hypothetical protein